MVAGVRRIRLIKSVRSAPLWTIRSSSSGFPARHIASETDVQQAYAVGCAAVEFAIAGKNAVMPAIRRLSDSPYRWDIIEVPLSEVANQEKMLPSDFIRSDGFGITE